jgi:hypothetical protein
MAMESVFYMPVCFIIIGNLTIYNTVDWCGKVVTHVIPTEVCGL